MVILGQMGELGDVSLEEHQRIVGYLQDIGMKDVWLIGEEFAKTNSLYRHFENTDQAKEAIRADQPQGHYILIKGSNSNRLFELPELL